MSYTSVGKRRIHYRDEGHGDHTLLFSNSLGASLAMWDAQAQQLAAEFRVLRYDHPGHGKSDPVQDDHDDAQFVHDALAVMDAAGVEKAHFIGLSMGGMIGQLLACQFPERVDTLTLCATGGKLPPADAWENRATTALSEGLATMVELSRGRWFTPGFIDQHAAAVQASLADLANVHPASYARCCRFIRDFDIFDRIHELTANSLLIAGQQDAATPPSMLEQLHRAMPGSRLEIVEPAAHMLSVERAAEVSALIRDFIRANTYAGHAAN